ncbi:MAG: 1-deoxy-D-xylulose-5-phosphate synthase [Clostridia bacterium]|nr:1-deoxy-D-xylulose-5-phosphate synthase [Clostridia bacterium]
MSVLEKVNSKTDLKQLNIAELKDLAKEIRCKIVETASTNGGHLASNLGVVELTIALHYVFDLPTDKLVFDVGHQCYTHKILSGRKEEFSSIRTSNGISGFPDKDESEFDTFTVGHAGTSLAQGLGLCSARDKQGEDYSVVVVVGDGSFSNGLNLEALTASDAKPKNLIVVLNDNGMSIAKNNNGFYKFISKSTTKRGYLKLKRGVKKVFRNSIITKFLKKCRGAIKRLFNKNYYLESFGFKFVGNTDGKHLEELISILQKVKNLSKTKAVFLHLNTTKGMGLEEAENMAEDFHGVGKNLKVGSGDFSTAFGKKVCSLIENDKNIIAITAGMTCGTGLKPVRENYPDNFVDVGIAEEYAVTYAAGLATGGIKPIVAVYSTFLQRSYDQILHDVCIPNLPVIFCVDRAGFVGSDGQTHQGLFDLSYLLHLPNLKVFAPKNTSELNKMLEYALTLNCPVAIRYPNGKHSDEPCQDEDISKWQKTYDFGNSVSVLAVGPRMNALALKTVKENNLNATVYNARCVKPLDSKVLDDIKNGKIITLEENGLIGGFGSLVSNYYKEKGVLAKVVSLGVKDGFVKHGSVENQLYENGLSEENLKAEIESN